MKYIKRFNSAEDALNHKLPKDSFVTIAGSNQIITNDTDNNITSVTDGKLVIKKNVTSISSENLEGKYSSDNAIYLVDSIVKGQKGSSNGKIMIDANDVTISHVYVSADAENGVYNVFEQPQTVSYPIEKCLVSDITVNGKNLRHNVLNLYNLADNAEVTIKNCKLDLNMKTSNAIRLSNYKNATGVTITFENVNWTYETYDYYDEDVEWAGLVIYQAAGADKMISGDTSAFDTWTIKFKDCYYNGTKVVSNNWGKENQVAYLYNVNKSGKTSEPTNLVFE